nr:MAG TPA: hypothetical protein [Caudoviricetes sp.]
MLPKCRCANLASGCRDTPTRIAGKATLHRRSKSPTFHCKRRTFIDVRTKLFFSEGRRLSNERAWSVSISLGTVVDNYIC